MIPLNHNTMAEPKSENQADLLDDIWKKFFSDIGLELAEEEQVRYREEIMGIIVAMAMESAAGKLSPEDADEFAACATLDEAVVFCRERGIDLPLLVSESAAEYREEMLGIRNFSQGYLEARKQDSSSL